MRQRSGRNPPKPPDWSKVFSGPVRLEVDLGCGRGHYALSRALASPASQLIALDTKSRWIAEIRKRALAQGITNLRAIRCDASHDLALLFAPGSVAGFSLHHPDPWWKKRHRKRRIIQADFVDRLADFLQASGWFYAQTDVPDLAAEIRSVFDASERFVPIDVEGLLNDSLGGAQSHRARKCAQLGIPVQRMAFRLVESKGDRP